MHSDWALVDFQYFLGNNGEIIVKELCVQQQGITDMFLFKPPFAWDELSYSRKRSNSYVSRFISGLNWSDGVTEYKSLANILYDLIGEKKVVMCKGKEKARFLKNVVGREIFDLDEVLFKKMDDLIEPEDVSTCLYCHDGKCAKTNVEKLVQWYNKIQEIVE